MRKTMILAGTGVKRGEGDDKRDTLRRAGAIGKDDPGKKNRDRKNDRGPLKLPKESRRQEAILPGTAAPSQKGGKGSPPPRFSPFRDAGRPYRWRSDT